MLLGTDILVMPFYHPVRLAEDVALLDVISGGRFILGTAIGYKPDEFALYGTPLEKRGARFEEGLKLMRTLWTEETATFKGQYYQLENGRIEPKPLHKAPPSGVDRGLGKAHSQAGGDAWGKTGSPAPQRT